MKTSELTGAALDWAVAKCEGEGEAAWAAHRDAFAYSSTWVCGGPIIERERIGIWSSEADDHDGEWCARTINTYITYSPTPLIAAMRCYVASKMGDNIDIPKELTE